MRATVNRARERGLTLPELITVLAVAGVLLTAGVPSYRKFALDNQVSTETNEFVFALLLARSEAGKRGTPVTVAAIDASDSGNEFGGGWNVFVDSDADGVLDRGEQLLRTGQGRSGSGTIDSTDDVSFVQYRPWGALSVAPAQRSFLLCDGRSGEIGRLVTVTTTGRTDVVQIQCS